MSAENGYSNGTHRTPINDWCVGPNYFRSLKIHLFSLWIWVNYPYSNLLIQVYCHFSLRKLHYYIWLMFKYPAYEKKYSNDDDDDDPLF